MIEFKHKTEHFEKKPINSWKDVIEAILIELINIFFIREKEKNELEHGGWVRTHIQ